MNEGFIKISNELYVNDWERLHVIMKDFRPTHIEFRSWENDIWYFYGVSKKFDKLTLGEFVPQYEVIITEDENKGLTYEFKRITSNIEIKDQNLDYPPRGVSEGIPPIGLRNWNCEVDGHADPDNSGLCIHCSTELD